MPPVQNLGAHVAPLGIEFVKSPQFADYTGQAFIAEHGSWNRTIPDGYRISRVPMAGGKGTGYETFIDGWLDGRRDGLGAPGGPGVDAGREPVGERRYVGGDL